MIGSFDDTGMVFSLFKQPSPSFNSGNAIVAKGSQYPVGGVSSALTSMEETYGWRKDLGAFRFDGVNDYINLGDVAALNNVNKFTILIWFNRSSVNTYETLMSKWAGNSDRVELLFFSLSGVDSLAMVNCKTAVLEYVSFPSASVLPASQDNCVIVTYDGTDAIPANRIKMYANGTVQSTTMSGTIQSSTSNSLSGTSLKVGSYATADSAFAGTIKNFTLFNVTKTTEEAAALYALGPDFGGLLLKSDGTLYKPRKNISHSTHVSVSVGI